VLYFTVNDAKSATYEVANPLQAIEQITVTTLRNVIGSLSLEDALTSRDHINAQLRGVLDEATGKWGIRVNRVEIKSIDPPGSSAAQLPVPADAAPARPGRRQQGIRDPVRVRGRVRWHRQGVCRERRQFGA